MRLSPLSANRRMEEAEPIPPMNWSRPSPVGPAARDGRQPASRVLLVDDLIATGGTAAAATELVAGAGASVVGCSFLIELTELDGTRALSTVDSVHAVIRY